MSGRGTFKASKISADGFDASSSGSSGGGPFISLCWRFDFPAFYLRDMITAPNTVESFKAKQHTPLDESHWLSLLKVWDSLQGTPSTTGDFSCQPLSSPKSELP